MKLALSQPNEIQHIRKFLNECGWLKDELRYMKLEDVDFSEFELLKDFNQKDSSEFLFSVLNEIKALYHEKALWNLETLIDNCADKTLDHLDFNPKINAGFDAIELLKEIDDYLSPNPKNHIYCQSVLHEKIKSVLSKVPVENEVSQNEA